MATATREMKVRLVLDDDEFRQKLAEIEERVAALAATVAKVRLEVDHGEDEE